MVAATYVSFALVAPFVFILGLANARESAQVLPLLLTGEAVLLAVLLLALVMLAQRYIAMPRLIWVTMALPLLASWAGPTGWTPDWGGAPASATIGFAVACLLVWLMNKALDSQRPASRNRDAAGLE
jgi:hypothetical protein